ncbi:hypothetical protein AGRA3207_001990 [Actinomadura graeca]|uniref:EthD domain-containing protein n=1 Tax=Actinomadura graeca TaxID=2750812 RepID=A0ABX8QQV0_9ACTN|nr:DUF4286 family protein [Actinomadura graeca]QXJ21164.1 hypothetical protein AGRA3207_001990 [Actinomadura graeca]
MDSEGSAARHWSPFLSMVGMSTVPGATPEDIARFHGFYDEVHVKEVLAANPGFGAPSRYELDHEPDPVTPRWLALYPIEEERHVDGYLERQRDPGLNARTYSAGPEVWSTATFVWRAVWRRVTAGDPPAGPVTGLLVAGVDPPSGATDAELAEFTDFYDTGHIPDILRHGGYRSYARYEKVADLPSAFRDHPRFCSVYTTDVPRDEADPESALAKAGRAGLLSRGPEVWQRRTTRWRLWFTPLTGAG